MSAYDQNKKATFNPEPPATSEAGVAHYGHEVKAIRASKAKLDGAYVIIRGGEAFLVGASVSPFQPVNTPKDYDPERARKLLLSKKELANLERESEHAGLTIVALRWYNKGQKLKLAIAIARGKKKTDKRETLKARDAKRDMDRTLKGE